mgnify:FL=1
MYRDMSTKTDRKVVVPKKKSKKSHIVRLDVQISPELMGKLDSVRGLAPRATFVRNLIEERVRDADTTIATQGNLRNT